MPAPVAPPLVDRRRGVHLPSSFAPLHFERQERYDALPALGVEDDVVGAVEHALQGFQIHAAAHHLRRLLVFLVVESRHDANIALFWK